MKFAAKLLSVLTFLSAFSVSQVSVKSYTRKDGTVVSGYTRTSPSRGDTKLYNPRPAPASPCAVSEGVIVCNGRVMSQYPIASAPVARDSRGRIVRSPEAKKSFQAQAPCPANHQTRGRCPGYVIDHIVPLACGGMDDPVNMQWQTTADGKAKDKWERQSCRK